MCAHTNLLNTAGSVYLHAIVKGMQHFQRQGIAALAGIELHVAVVDLEEEIYPGVRK